MFVKSFDIAVQMDLQKVQLEIGKKKLKESNNFKRQHLIYRHAGVPVDAPSRHEQRY